MFCVNGTDVLVAVSYQCSTEPLVFQVTVANSSLFPVC